MASFDISYIIKAVDKFSGPASKICASVNKLQNKFHDLNKSTSKVGENIAASAKSFKNAKQSYSFTKPKDSINEMNHSLHRSIDLTKKLTYQQSKNAHRADSIFKRFSHRSDQFARSAYYRMLNIGLPVMMVAMPLYKDLAATEQSLSALRVSAPGEYRAIIAEAEKLNKTTLFTKVQVLQTAQALAAAGVKGKPLVAAMQGLVNLGAATGVKNLRTLAEQLIRIATSPGRQRIPGTDMFVTGAGADRRLMRELKQIQKQYSDAAIKQTQTLTGQMQLAFRQLKDNMMPILKLMLPVLLDYAKKIGMVVKNFSQWVQKNPVVAKGLAHTAAFTFLALSAMTLLGAVMGVLEFAFVGLGKPISLLIKAFRVLRVVMAADVFLALLNPIGLVLASLIAVAAEIHEIIKLMNDIKHYKGSFFKGFFEMPTFSGGLTHKQILQYRHSHMKAHVHVELSGNQAVQKSSVSSTTPNLSVSLGNNTHGDAANPLMYHAFL